MKKHCLLLVIALFAAVTAGAAERTWQQKRQIALSVLGTQAQTRGAQAGELKLLKEATGLSVVGYDGGGFAVISNDDSQEAVLGWSDGKFGTDLPDGSDYSNIVQYAPGSGYGYYTTAVRQAAQRIMYTVANSNAMNGYDENARIVHLIPWWLGACIGITVGVGTLMIASVTLHIAVTVNKRRSGEAEA